MLSDPLEGAKLAVTEALGAIGPAAEPAIPELIKRLDAPLAAEGDAAAEALSDIAPRDPRVVAALAVHPRSTASHKPATQR